MTIERVELLSNLFPGKKRYGAVGYGHRVSFLTQTWDDADKPGVLAENLHATWPRRFNALANGYTELRFRLPSWADYFRMLQSLREKVLAAFGDLRQATIILKNSAATQGAVPLKRPTEWDECRLEANKDLLLPRVAVDEWGFITESSAGNTVDFRSERYSGLHRFAPVRKAVGEYTRAVGNFMSQALDCLILVPHLRVAESQSAKDRLVATAAKLGVNENSIRLSVVNGVDACAAIEQLQMATRMVFEKRNCQAQDSAFCERERRELVSTITAWCIFVDDETRRQFAGNSKGKSKHRQRKPKKVTELSDLLVQTRNRVRDSLQALRKQGIEARLLSDKILWNGMPALWITCDAVHPISLLNAVETTWYQLVAAFAPDREKIVRVKAIELMWPSIILVPLVAGKSLERQAMPHFMGVTYVIPPDLKESPWRLFPEQIPEDIWLQLGLDHWEVQPNWFVFDQFSAAYGLLFHHVDHMADFHRIPGKLDELGLSILQSYLDHETKRAQPLLQESFDSCANVLSKFPEIDDQVIQNRPNICLCMQILVDMKHAIMPISDFHLEAKLTTDQVVDWRDRLLKGMQQLGIARYLWIADSLNFGAPH